MKGKMVIVNPLFRLIAKRALVYDRKQRASAKDLLSLFHVTTTEDKTSQEVALIPAMQTAIVKQPRLESERILYVDWMIEMAYTKLNLETYTLHLAAHILHRYVAHGNSPDMSVALAVMYIAAKLNECDFGEAENFVQMCHNIVTVESMLAAEHALLKTVGFALWNPDAPCLSWTSFFKTRKDVDLSLFLNPAPDAQTLSQKRAREDDDTDPVMKSIKRLRSNAQTVGVTRVYG